MTWDEYYDRFYDWAESTQISRISQLETYGPSEEICEVAASFIDEKAASRLIRKALKAGVKFRVSEIRELVECVSDDVWPELVESNSDTYSNEVLDDLLECGFIDTWQYEALGKSSVQSGDTTFTWERFYNMFSSWPEDMQNSRALSQKQFGPSAQVVKIYYEIPDTKTANSFLCNALAASVKFSVEEIKELLDSVEDKDKAALVNSNKTPYTKADLDYLYDYVDESLLRKLAKKNCPDYILPFEDLDYELINSGYGEASVGSPKLGLGMVLAIIAGVFIGSLANPSGKKGKKTHNGHCDGNCAACPPHYGYRYGRWYYGHGHMYGCQFGGNRRGGWN